MMFGLFGSKRKNESIADLLGEFLTYQQLVGQISKAQSLQKLNRTDEAQRVLSNAEHLATTYVTQHPRDKKAYMMLVLFYIETGTRGRAEPLLDHLLTAAEFQLTDDERIVIGGELQKIRRQRPIDQRPSDCPEGFTHVFCCANCGRLHNFVSVPCPHCDWSPQGIEETARSIVLSNAHFKIPALLTLAREMSKGRAANDIVPNLLNDGRSYLSDSKQRLDVERVFAMLKENEHKNHRSLSMVRACPECGHRVLLSSAEECKECRAPVRWPDAIRLLACMDNLLWLHEQRIEVSNTNEFSDFVCILVAMTNNLLRKQEVPSTHDRQYSLKLLGALGAICDLNKGAVIDTKNPRALEIYLVKDSMRDDSESFGLFILNELEFFVEKMVAGIRS
jgi:hypothetical protein